MLKKLLALLSSAALLLTLTACGGGDASGSSDRSDSDGSISSGESAQSDTSVPDGSNPESSSRPAKKPQSDSKKDPSKPKNPTVPKGNLSDLYDEDGPSELAVTGLLINDPWGDGYVFLAPSDSGYGWEFLNTTSALSDVEGLDKGVGMTVIFDRSSTSAVDFFPESCDFTLEHVETIFKASCASYPYSELLSNPDLHFGESVQVTAQVFQVTGDSSHSEVELLAYVGENTDPIAVEYKRHSPSEPLPAEGDMLNIYGFGQELFTCAGADSQTITVPLIDAVYMEKA